MRTPVDVPPSLRKLAVTDNVVFLGSCFAEHMGRGFAQARLRATVNPLGAVYSPAALARVLEAGDAGSLAEGPQGWHSWLTDTSLTAATETVCREKAEEARKALCQRLREADFLFLTLGTSRYYRLRETGETVVNCHKHPQREFEETDQSAEEIAGELERALGRWRSENPRLTVTLTVSPYRYAKYGFHESQLSKARLLLACDQLQRRNSDWIQYFPAYEIVQDELRDYRYYADDMLHVSAAATAYIWHRLMEWMDEGLLDYLDRWQRVERTVAHRPRQEDSPQWRLLCERAQQELEQLQRDYPMLQIE